MSTWIVLLLSPSFKSNTLQSDQNATFDKVKLPSFEISWQRNILWSRFFLENMRVVPAMAAARQGVFWLTGLPWRARELWLFNPVFLSTLPVIIISHPLIINLSHYCLHWLRKLAKNRVIVNTSRSLVMLADENIQPRL